MPTPVSALIHAATMVTAGVYLLIRTSPLIEYSSTVLILCLWVGAITTLFSSLIGLFQQDIKKVIAYSTMSQLAREFFKFRHQTICVEIIYYIINSQITKAHNYFFNNYIIFSFFNSYFAAALQRQYFYILSYPVMSEIWKVINISKQVGISEAIRLILIFFNLKKFILKKTFILIVKIVFIYYIMLNITVNNLYSIWFICPIPHFLLNISDINADSDITNSLKFNSNSDIFNNSNDNSVKELAFKQWLAGLIDGDGYFILTKKGYTSCEITMDNRDKKALYEIKQKYGGSVKSISNANALRYKLRHKKGLILLINDVNGHLRNPTRLLQINKLCLKYNIELKYPEPLVFNNGWLSGFIDSDGSIYFNEQSGQVFISITQKNKYLLDPLIKLYNGRVDIVSPKIEAFKYIIYRKSELFNLIDNYFNKYPLKTKKMNRVLLIKNFYQLRIYRNNDDIIKFNEWIIFKNKWNKYIG